MTDVIAVATRELIRQIEEAEKERDEAIEWADGLADSLARATRGDASNPWAERLISYRAWKASR